MVAFLPRNPEHLHPSSALERKRLRRVAAEEACGMRQHGGRAFTTGGPFLAAGLLAATPFPALAQPAVLTAASDPALAALAAVTVGAVAFAVLSAVTLIRAKVACDRENARLGNELAGLRAALDRAEALVDCPDQRIVVWDGGGEVRLVAGTLRPAADVPADRAEFLAFDGWLKPDSADRLDRALHRLRDTGESFALVLEARAGRLIEGDGRTIGDAAVARFRDLSGDRLARAEIEAAHGRIRAEAATMRSLLEAMPAPGWIHGADGRLVWVNAAYARSVGAADPAEAVARSLALFEDLRTADGRRAAMLAGVGRRVFEVTTASTVWGGAGLAVDVTAAEAAEATLRRETDFNARTLDQLATAVAIFGPDRRLRSANAAYRRLFDLDAAFLQSQPDEHAVLDRLRAERRLPEQADFKAWRGELLSAYSTAETSEHWWHLPDGQTLRVIANPNPQGGMTWVYENVTERLALESRYNALIQVQGATLDHLAEGVAVFGSDGRLRLHNPAFAQRLGLDEAFLARRPHVADVADACRQPFEDVGFWSGFAARVAGLDEMRSGFGGRIDRAPGRVLDYATVPLPGGQTMVTFVDVTDSVQVERALVERNDALEAADRLKSAFIHHVSYELRSPLTNIIGFTQLLADPEVGPLTERQREYTGYVLSSSAALLAIVNDILDLASVDAGIMELDLGEVAIAETVAAAIEGVQDRLEESRIVLETRIPADIGAFVADGKRVRQILFNLLANAIAFSQPGAKVVVDVAREADMVAFTIADKGPGIPGDFVAAAFDRFASRPRGASRGGAGLGLSIVKSFAGLHGGDVEIRSVEGQGTAVVCRLPIRPQLAAQAAE